MTANTLKCWIIISLLGISFGLLEGCVSVSDSAFRIIDGKEFFYHDVDSIVKGTTTRQEILRRFGEPCAKTDNKWAYYFVKEKIGEARLWFLVLSRSGMQSRTELEIIFKDNIVDDYIIKRDAKTI